MFRLISLTAAGVLLLLNLSLAPTLPFSTSNIKTVRGDFGRDVSTCENKGMLYE